MEHRETPRMRKYGESKTTQIMMTTVRHVTAWAGLRKFQADGFLFDWVYLMQTVWPWSGLGANLFIVPRAPVCNRYSLVNTVICTVCVWNKEQLLSFWCIKMKFPLEFTG